MRGADAVVFAAGAGPGSGAARKQTVDRDAAILLADAAEAAGVGRYVMVSALSADDRSLDENYDEVFLAYMPPSPRRMPTCGPAPDCGPPSCVRAGSTDEPGTGNVTVADSTGRGSIPREDVAGVLLAVLHEPETAGRTFEVISRRDAHRLGAAPDRSHLRGQRSTRRTPVDQATAHVLTASKPFSTNTSCRTGGPETRRVQKVIR